MFKRSFLAMIIASLFIFSSIAAASVDSLVCESSSDTESLGFYDPGIEQASDDQIDFDPSVIEGYFTENQGQWSDEIRFIARAEFGTVAFMDGSVLYVLPTDDNSTNEIIELRFVDPNPASVAPSEPLQHRSNFFVGGDQDNWHSEVMNYGRITYLNVWEGIDLHYFFTAEGVKYEFHLAPHSNIENIRISVDGADLCTTGDSLIIETSYNRIVDDSLCAVYSDMEEVSSSFIVLGNEYSFDVQGWDDSRELIIDPLVYSTYVGGSNSDETYSITIDSSGNAFVAGATSSTDFPTTPGAYQTSYVGGYTDVFILKLNSTGSDLLYSTYVGGSDYDLVRSIATDSSGNAFVAGETDSADFPTTAGAYQTSLAGNYDVFILKLNSTGSDLLHSTYVGGSGQDMALSIDIDSSGNAFVAGYTSSTDFPIMEGAYQTSLLGDSDAFILKLNSTGSDLLYSTYFGGSGHDMALSIDIDSSGNAFVSGATSSTDFPTTPGAYQTSLQGDSDVFILKLNSTGSDLLHSTYVGGSGHDMAASIAIDSSGNAFVAGETNSTDFPTTPGIYQTSYAGGYSDVFILKLNSTGSDLLYSTYVGGSDDDGAASIGIDSSGNAFVAGDTDSADFPTTPGAYQTSLAGDSDTFILKLSTAIAPSAPQNLQASTGNQYVNITWSAPSDDGGESITAYNIYRGTNNLTYSLHEVVSSDVFSFNDTSVTNGQIYYYQVSANNSVGEGPRSMAVSETPMNTSSAPQNLQANAEDGQITLTWIAPSDNGGFAITDYRIYRGISSSSLIPIETIGNEITYPDDSVTNGITYYYRVSAINSVGEGSQSNLVSATPLGVPSALRNLQVNAGDGQVTLTWEPPSDNGGSAITGYNIYRGNSSNSLSLLVTIGNVLNHTDSTVSNGQTYYYQVKAVNEAGEGEELVVIGVTPEGGTGIMDDWMWILLVVVVIVAMILAIFMVTRRMSPSDRVPLSKGPQEQDLPLPSEEGGTESSVSFCPYCGKPTEGGQYCEHCGEKIKDEDD